MNTRIFQNIQSKTMAASDCAWRFRVCCASQRNNRSPSSCHTRSTAPPTHGFANSSTNFGVKTPLNTHSLISPAQSYTLHTCWWAGQLISELLWEPAHSTCCLTCSKPLHSTSLFTAKCTHLCMHSSIPHTHKCIDLVDLSKTQNWRLWHRLTAQGCCKHSLLSVGKVHNPARVGVFTLCIQHNHKRLLCKEKERTQHSW